MNDPENQSGLDQDDATRISGSSQRQNLGSLHDPPTVVNQLTKLSNKTGGSGHGSSQNTGHNARSEQMPLAGTKIGIYELGPPIGTGGMATVYAAQDLSLERTVALKILPPKSSEDNEVLQRFLLEGKAAAQLDHPNIARIHALGHDSTYYYLAFEYVEGRTVRQWIEDRGRIEIDQVLDWSIQVADALAHADRRGVVHRDIKPSNLIVTPSNQIKLVDLGLARRYETQGQVDLTQSGVTLGTFDYISPEQARDPRNVDIRSDLYSLGCTMFHMLSGQPPFPGQNVVQKLLQHQEKAPPNLAEIQHETPEALSALVRRLMAKSPADRPASAEICAMELREISASLKSSSNDSLEVEPSCLKGTLLWLIPAIVMAFIVTSVSWFWGDLQNSGTPTLTSNAETSSTLEVDQRTNKVITQGGNPDQSEAIVPILLDSSVVKRQQEGLLFRVSNGPQLIDALKQATPGSVITLTENANYLLETDRIPKLANTDLVIKSAPGIRPLIQPVIPRDTLDQIEIDGPESIRLQMFDFINSRITIQGLTFDLRGSNSSVPLSCVAVEESDLTLRDSRFLTDHAALLDFSSFIQIRKADSQEEGQSWRPIRIENCRFWGPRIAIRAQGPVDLNITETASISPEPLVSMDQNEEDNLWPCTIQLSHVSVMATGWTAILELNNAMARVRTQNCLFAPSPGGQISLVSSRRPSRLDWFGRGNVYGEVTTFLESTRFTEEVLDFESWSRADGILREQNSYSTKQSVFSPVDSTLLASQGRWPEAFSLNRGPWTSMSAGVQSWSEQTRLEPPILVAENQDNRTPRIAAVKPAETEAIPPSAAELTANLRNGQDIAEAKSPKQDNTPLPMPMPMPMETVPFRSEGIGTGVSRNDPPLFTNEVRSPVTDTSQTTASVNNGFLGLGSRRTTTSGSSGTGSKSPNPDSPTVKMVSDKRSFLAALKENSDNGTNLTISGLSFLDLDQPVKLDSGKWQIGSEPGALRPVLEMTVPKQSPENNQARWVLKEGVSLKFRSVDFIWDSENPNDSRLFELNPGAQLVFEDCTLTLKGNRSDLFFFEITGSEFNGFDEVSSQKTSIRLIDSIVRTAGGLFRGRSDIRADLEMTGTLAITGGPLVSVDSPSRPHTTQTTRFQLNQTTAILGSSLASVSIGRRPVDTPYLSFQSRRSIISTDPRTERSMIEVRGGDPNQINEDAVEWDGDEVGYHQWQTYRTDQNDLSGMSVRRQNREDWQLNHAENDTQPVHGDLGFIRDFWLTNRPVWQASPSDFAIRENAPGEGLGAKLDRLPQVPELKTDFDAFEGFIP